MRNIILSNYKGLCNLGHEIHLTRIILLDLLAKDIIKADKVKIYTMKDRIFLYSKIFKYVYDFNTKPDDNLNDLDLTPYLTTQLNDTTQSLKNLNYDMSISKDRTPKFLEYATMLDFYYIDTNNKFVIIHARNNGKTDNLQSIINVFLNKTSYDIVIFSMSNNINYEKDKRITFITNLKVYASYLNNKYCELVISEWSGGGQLAQYCCNSKIIYYYHTYPPDYINNFQEILNKTNTSDSLIHPDWDFKNCTNLKIMHVPNSDSLLLYINNII